MDKQQFSFYRKNTIYLFIIAAFIMAVSILATVLVLTPARTLMAESSVLLTLLLWIMLLLGTVFGESKKIAIFNMVVSIVGFICAFVLAVVLFSREKSDALSFFLFWISQILNAVFILSSYFSVQAFLETRKKSVSLKVSKPKKVNRVQKQTEK